MAPKKYSSRTASLPIDVGSSRVPLATSRSSRAFSKSSTAEDVDVSASKRQDRKLMNDITSKLYRIEIDTVKPGVIVQVKTSGIRRAPYRRRYTSPITTLDDTTSRPRLTSARRMTQFDDSAEQSEHTAPHSSYRSRRAKLTDGPKCDQVSTRNNDHPKYDLEELFSRSLHHKENLTNSRVLSYTDQRLDDFLSRMRRATSPQYGAETSRKPAPTKRQVLPVYADDTDDVDVLPSVRTVRRVVEEVSPRRKLYVLPVRVQVGNEELLSRYEPSNTSIGRKLRDSRSEVEGFDRFIENEFGRAPQPSATQVNSTAPSNTSIGRKLRDSRSELEDFEHFIENVFGRRPQPSATQVYSTAPRYGRSYYIPPPAYRYNEPSYDITSTRDFNTKYDVLQPKSFSRSFHDYEPPVSTTLGSYHRRHGNYVTSDSDSYPELWMTSSFSDVRRRAREAIYRGRRYPYYYSGYYYN